MFLKLVVNFLNNPCLNKVIDSSGISGNQV